MKKGWIIFFGILVLLLIIICLFFRGYLIYIATGKITNSLCQSSSTYTIFNMYKEFKMDTLDHCIFSIAYNRHKPELCEQSTTKETRDSCMMGMAFNADMPELCKTVTTPGYAEQCKARYG